MAAARQRSRSPGFAPSESVPPFAADPPGSRSPKYSRSASQRAGGAARCERVESLEYLGIVGVGASKIFEELARRGSIAAPPAHVGESDPAVIVVGALRDQPAECALRRLEPTGPALQLGDPEAILEALRLERDHGAVGGEGFGQPLLPPKLLGVLPSHRGGLDADIWASASGALKQEAKSTATMIRAA